MATSQDLPGFWDRIREERRAQLARRRGAYSRDRLAILGEPVRPLTLADCDWLEGIGSPILCGGDATDADAWRLLWRVHRDYRPGPSFLASWRRGAVARRIAARTSGNRAALVEAVAEYVGQMFGEFPQGSESGVTSWGVASIAVSLVAQVQQAGYALSDAEILALPLPVVAGKLAVAARKSDPEWRENDAARRVQRDYMAWWLAMDEDERQAAIKEQTA